MAAPQPLASLLLFFHLSHIPSCIPKPQPPTFSASVQPLHPQAPSSLEGRRVCSIKQLLRVAFDMEIFKIAATKQWSITSTTCQIFIWRTASSIFFQYSAPSAHHFTQSARKMGSDQQPQIHTHARAHTHTHTITHHPHHHFSVFFPPAFLSVSSLADLDSEKRGDGKTWLQQNQNAFQQSCRLAFCYAAR